MRPVDTESFDVCRTTSSARSDSDILIFHKVIKFCSPIIRFQMSNSFRKTPDTQIASLWKWSLIPSNSHIGFPNHPSTSILERLMNKKCHNNLYLCVYFRLKYFNFLTYKGSLKILNKTISKWLSQQREAKSWNI